MRAHLFDILGSHGSREVLFIGKHQQTSSRQPLRHTTQTSHNRSPTHTPYILPLALAVSGVQPYSPPVSCGQHCPQPTQARLSTRNSSSSRTSETSAHQHPICSGSTFSVSVCVRVCVYIGLSTHPLCSTVLMLKPKVGEMVVMSSPKNFFTIVVFPALSRPLYTHHTETHTQNTFTHTQNWHIYSISILQSFSFCFIFLKIDRRTIATVSLEITPTSLQTFCSIRDVIGQPVYIYGHRARETGGSHK